MTATTMTSEARESLRQEMIAWELSQARVYGEPLTHEAAERKVDAGLARIYARHGIA